MSDADLSAPRRALFYTEPGRATLDFALVPVMSPMLRAAPRGHGDPVMVFPGLGGGDGSTLPLRLYLRAKGYAVFGWNQGRNVGANGLLEVLQTRLEAVYEQAGCAVSLVGWSLGGIYARELAKRAPDLVRCVVTLGSPFKGPAEASNVHRVYEWLSGNRGVRGYASAALEQTPDVPTTAIFTRADGIVAWQRCVEPPRERVESIEVPGSHCGLGQNAFVLYAIADRLAENPDNWQPFSPRPRQRLFYRDPWRDSSG